MYKKLIKSMWKRVHKNYDMWGIWAVVKNFRIMQLKQFILQMLMFGLTAALFGKLDAAGVMGVAPVILKISALIITIIVISGRWLLIYRIRDLIRHKYGSKRDELVVVDVAGIGTLRDIKYMK